jgi:Tol biopolymer transport system component
VLDIAFAPDRSLVLAVAADGASQILRSTAGGQWVRLTNGEERYPAVSPDGRWLAFSRSNGRAWNLWFQNLQTGEERRLTDADCNQVTPSWEPDSKSILYATDCGRGLFLTALARRRVIP